MADDRLDLLLGVWARQARLDQRQSTAMLRAITDEPHETLPATWWTDLSTHVTAAVVLATARPATPVGVPGAQFAGAAA